MNYFMITGVWWKRFLVPLMPSDKDFGTLNKRVNLSYSLRERNTKYTGINNAYIPVHHVPLNLFKPENG